LRRQAITSHVFSVEEMLDEPHSFSRIECEDLLREWKVKQNEIRSCVLEAASIMETSLEQRAPAHQINTKREGAILDALEEDLAQTKAEIRHLRAEVRESQEDASPAAQERQEHTTRELTRLERDLAPAVISCDKGHTMNVEELLSQAVIYDSIPCPQCVGSGHAPPFCFNRKECIHRFNAEALQGNRAGTIKCEYCESAGRYAQVRLVDIVVPGLFPLMLDLF
jgi:hypothetical protein